MVNWQQRTVVRLTLSPSYCFEDVKYPLDLNITLIEFTKQKDDQFANTTSELIRISNA